MLSQNLQLYFMNAVCRISCFCKQRFFYQKEQSAVISERIFAIAAKSAENLLPKKLRIKIKNIINFKGELPYNYLTMP